MSVALLERLACDLLDGTQDPQEPLHVRWCDAAAHGILERRQVIVNVRCEPAPLPRRVDDKRPSVLGADFARDQFSLGQSVENAGERRTFVRQSRVKLRDRRRRGGRQVREDMRFSLRQPVLAKISEVQADAMCRAMDRGNQA